MGYSWSPQEAMSLLGIDLGNCTEKKISCPRCDGKKFYMNTQKGVGHCMHCNFSADTAGYYAAVNGLSLAEARREIESRLGITPDYGMSERDRLKERVVYKTTPQEEKRAEASVLNDTYRAFLDMLTLSPRHVSDMRARCLMDESTLESLNYKSFPDAGSVNYFWLCKQMLKEGHILDYVPGFFRTKKGEGDFVFHQMTPGILMPLVNHKMQIIGLQLRKDDDKRIWIEEEGEYEQKCGWFSSKGNACGAGATAGIHYACDWKYDFEKGEYHPVHEDGFLLTEGIMKADIIHYLMPNIPCIAVPGVNATRYLEIELKRLQSWGVKKIRLAYDMDYKSNPHVQTALEKTERMIADCGMTLIRTEWEEQVPEKQGIYLKGLDDYLAYCKLGIVPKIKDVTTKKEEV